MFRSLVAAPALALLLGGGLAFAAKAAPLPDLTPADVETVYFRALAFYRPPANQSRWLDSRLLDETGDPGAARTLDPALAARLVERLGTRFCRLEDPDRCRKNRGAQLRVSELGAEPDGRVHVTVGCRLVWPRGTTIDNGRQTFVLARDRGDWKIVERFGGNPR
jgi:hypothetical protein